MVQDGTWRHSLDLLEPSLRETAGRMSTLEWLWEDSIAKWAAEVGDRVNPNADCSSPRSSANIEGTMKRSEFALRWSLL